MSVNKKAIIFDLDGTVIDTIADIAAALNRAMASFGFPERTVAEVQSFLGNGSLMLVRRAIGAENDADLCLAVRSRFREEYEKGMFDLTKPYNGIKELLEELSSMGVKTAVVTNKDDKCAVQMIDRFFGNAVVFTRGVRRDDERKPDPTVTLRVLSDFGVSPEEALFVGDGMADLNAAKNGGIDFVPVGYGYTSRERLFDACGTEPVQSVDELRRKLLEYL